MPILKKIVALAIIATFLALIPLAFADNNAGLVMVVNELKVGTNSAKPPGTPGGSKVEPSYVLIAKGLYTVPANLYYDAGSSPDTGFKDAIIGSITEYETKANENLFQTPQSGSNLNADTVAPDGKNELLFGNLASTNTIAVTYSWITRGTKKIVEFDIVFNTDYPWGNAGPLSETTLQDQTKMDTQDIVTHEMGHAVGLGDLYQSQNSKATMFGFASNGETWKRTLESGDIAGLRALYP